VRPACVAAGAYESAFAWWPVFALQLIAFGFKEDTIVLVPLVLVLTGFRALMLRDVRLPPWPIVALGFVTPIGLFALRYKMLGVLGGYGAPPSAAKAWINFSNGLIGVLRQVPVKRPWQPFVSVFSQTVLCVGGLASFFRRDRAYLFFSGLAIAVFFNLPFIFVSKAEQFHLLALGAVIALAAAMDAIVGIVPTLFRLRMLAAVGTVAASLSSLPVTRNIVRDFEPCSDGTLYVDDLTVGWWVRPPEIQAWMKAKTECRHPRARNEPHRYRRHAGLCAG
jgi:hypothetical protein